MIPGGHPEGISYLAYRPTALPPYTSWVTL